MKDVQIPMQTCLKMLEMPRAYIIKVLIDKISISLGLSEDMEDEDQDLCSEGHLDPPETD